MVYQKERDTEGSTADPRPIKVFYSTSDIFDEKEKDEAPDETDFLDYGDENYDKIHDIWSRFCLIKKINQPNSNNNIPFEIDYSEDYLNSIATQTPYVLREPNEEDPEELSNPLELKLQKQDKKPEEQEEPDNPQEPEQPPETEETEPLELREIIRNAA